MKYVSTRGGVDGLEFQESLLTGLAPDGGLLIPEQIVDVGAELESWRGLSFVPFAQAVIAKFATDIDERTLNGLIADAYATFDCEDVVGWRTLGDVELLELFHGPTLAFKDVALQLLGRLFEYVLAREHRHLNILGATSGDTGSAAIAGVRGQPNIDIFILYPHGKVSALQEMQMTTVSDANVHCLAVRGNFDDCQALMKAAFNDPVFKQELSLGAINSVNWARVMAQIVYYGYAALRFDAPVSFCVPTGNFGNVFAAYLARRMGFPIDKLIVATNENDILARFFASGDYARGEVHFTLSPAMDIQVASNFERYLYYLTGGDTGKLNAFMRDFAHDAQASIDLGGATPDFHATAIDTAETLATIKRVYEESRYVLDPHSAVGVAAANKIRRTTEIDGPLVCVATAHPAKFPEAVARALPDVSVSHPTLQALQGLEQRRDVIDNDVAAVKDYMRTHARGFAS